MSVVLIRHSLSEANNRENYGKPAFGNPKSPLMPKGWEQAAKAAALLTSKYGVVLGNTRAATSTMQRSKDTGEGIGFGVCTEYACLDEVDPGISHEELRALLNRREVPAAALVKADIILEDPPRERFWVTHGLTMLGLLDRFGIERPADGRFVPGFCEAIEIPLRD